MKILSKAVDIRIVIAVFILFLVLPQTLLAEDSVSTDFESCILQEYGDSQLSPEAAYQIGACFYEIVHERCMHQGDFELANKSLMTLSNVSSHIILQYADSWFVLAAKDGHQTAMQQLAKTRKKLDTVTP
ncbi:hypothetical protein A9Q81_23990 [Gammaproteobacteria bacterium 42_54_T18]|nr:hypothetical protein A9Q81_23990 [Gammaproteobacteria bacterium 42_54_T18]